MLPRACRWPEPSSASAADARRPNHSWHARRAGIRRAGVSALLACPLVFAPGIAAASPAAPPAEEAGGETAPEDAADNDGAADASVSASGGKGKAKGKGIGRKERTPSYMKGRVGFGAVRTLSGLNGLTARFYVVDRFSLGATFGFASFSFKDANPDTGEYTDRRTVAYFGTGLDGMFWAVQGDRSHVVHADFGLGGRFLVYKGLTGADRRANGHRIDPFEIDIELLAAAPVWIGRRVAITPEFGAAIRIIPGNREPDQNNESDTNPGTGAAERLGAPAGPGFGVEIGDHAGLFMGLSVMYHFGKLAGG